MSFPRPPPHLKGSSSQLPTLVAGLLGISGWLVSLPCSTPHLVSCTSQVNHTPSILTSGSASGSPACYFSWLALLKGAQRITSGKTLGTGELVPAGTVGPWHVCPPGTSSFPALCPLLMRSWHASSFQKTPDHMELWLAPQSSQGRAWSHQSMPCDCTKGTADNMQSLKTIIFC